MGGPSGELLAALQASISDAAGSFRIERTTPVAGGCIHRCFILEGGGRRYFAKTNDRSALDSFAAEADGLAALARSLARVHSIRGKSFGWRRDNYIGRTPQLNRCSPSWSDFWREARLGPQLELARKNGFGKSLLEKGEQLAEAVPGLLSEHAPAASLLHGDLWSGNAAFLFRLPGSRTPGSGLRCQKDALQPVPRT